MATHPALPISIEDVRLAARRIESLATRTPVLRSRTLDERAGARLFFKCESFQRVGAFKFRGAANAVFSLDETTARRGVVTHSSGNHAAALALAARLRGIPAQVVIPEGAPAAKVDAVDRYGATIVRCAPTFAAREEAAARVLAETGGTLVHPFNDLRVMAGQGTLALELLTEQPDLDILVAPISGGGLLSGCAVAARGVRPAIEIVGAEPSGADDAARSLAAGALVREPAPQTICDGLRGFLGPLTFSVLQAHRVAIATATDEQTSRAMRRVWEILKIVVEPSAAIALAVVLERRFPFASGARIGVVLSGGNVDLDALPFSRIQE